MDQQNSAMNKHQLKEAANNEIYAVKTDAKAKISEIKYRLQMDLLADNSAAVNKACRKENKRRYNEAKAEELKKQPKRYSAGEEIFNSITHGIGAGLSIAALVILCAVAVNSSSPDRTLYTVGSAVFGSSMILLYLMSTMYHALTPYGAKRVFAVFDHTSIYVLIAGTYTPFCLAVLHGALGWTMFGIIWGLAVIGITFYAVFGSRMRLLSAVTYVLMGWLIIFAFKPMSERLPRESLAFLVSGGAAYTVGVVFYALKKIKWTHSIWHLFVIMGSVLHFFSVLYSIPA